MKTTVSGALPIHNEEKYLPYMLDSISDASLDELVVVLDRCEDSSLGIVEKFQEVVSYPIKIVEIKEGRWKYSSTEIFKIALSRCTKNVIYPLGADCIYNPQIFRVDLSLYDIVAFPFIDYDIFEQFNRIKVTWGNCYRNLIRRIYPLLKKNIYSGIMGIKKHLLNSILPQIDSFDIFIWNHIIPLGWKYKFFPRIMNLHLRPKFYERDKQVTQAYHKSGYRIPLWKALAQGFVNLKPYMLQTYLRLKLQNRRCD